jgi:hypothetical protein
MFDSIKKTAIRDGVPTTHANVLVEVFKDRSHKEMARIIGFDEHEIKRQLHSLFYRFKVKNKAQLIVKCAPYIKGELINNKGVEQ